MNRYFFDAIVSNPILISVGWSLFHFVWQAALIALIVALALSVFRNSSARVRYLIGCVGLVAMALLPVATLMWYLATTNSVSQGRISNQLALTENLFNRDSESIVQVAPAFDHQGFDDGAANHSANKGVTSNLAAQTASPIPISSSGWLQWKQSLQSSLPWMVLVWLVGVSALSLRLVLGLYQVRCWRRDCQPLQSAEVLDIVRRLSHRMGLHRSVAILESARANVPAVVGWLRPTILFPVSMISGLNQSELESILAHELAHIRRHDFLVNLLQSLVETVLFYHPAVWWLSNRIRAERENCCDDIAIDVCGNRLVLARALTRMEELRCGQGNLVVAANGGSLMARIQRIVGAKPVCASDSWPVGVIGFCAIGLTAGALFLSAAMAQSGDVSRDQDQADINITPDPMPVPDPMPGLTYPQMSTSSNHPPDDHERAEQPGVKTITTHTYNMNQRKSKRWVKVNGSNVPVDDGVSREGTFVAMTLMFDIVAVREADDELVWHLDWGKSDPMWRTISIVELDRGEKEKLVAVELFAVDPTLNEPLYKYYSLTTGAELAAPDLRQIQVFRLQHVPASLAAKLLSARINPPDSPDSPARISAEVRTNSIIMTGSNVEFQDARNFLKELDQPEMAEMLRADPANQWITDVIPLAVVEKDELIAKRIELRAKSQGRRPKDLVQRWESMPNFNIETADSITEAETLVSVDQNARSIGNVVDADEIIFNLPEGSGIRAEFFGEKVEIVTVDDQKSVVVTSGKVQLLDQGGVVRAWASPDGGAEQLVADVRDKGGEYVMRLKARRLVHDPDFIPNMQCVTFPETGAPADEDQPPHGAVRYEVLLDPAAHKFRFKIKWRYDVQRIRQEVSSNSKDVEVLSPQVADSFPELLKQIAQAKPESNQSEPPWGREAERSGLQSRLTIQSTELEIGKPLRVKLELKNSGDQPTKVDLQTYWPQRVIRAERTDRVAGRFAPLIAMTPQTSANVITLKPGQSHEVWSNVDVTEILLMSEPGEYFIYAEGGQWATQPLWRDSNRVKVDLKPGVLPQRQQLLAGLHEILPADWRVSIRADEIYLSHVATNLKKDVTTVAIRFSTDHLPDDQGVGLPIPGRDREFANVKYDYLGKFGLHHVYLLCHRSHTENVWPDYRKVIERQFKQIFDSTTNEEIDRHNRSDNSP